MDAFNDIIQLVEACVVETQALNQCLKNDQHYLKMNDLISMEQSDANKESIHQRLSGHFQQLVQHAVLNLSYGDLFVKLSYYAGGRETAQQNQLLTLIQQLREAYMTSAGLLQVNKQVVNANLAYVKDVISQLTQSDTRISKNTYSQAGVLT